MPGNFFAVNLLQRNGMFLRELDGKMTGAVENHTNDDQDNTRQGNQNECNWIHSIPPERWKRAAFGQL